MWVRKVHLLSLNHYSFLVLFVIAGSPTWSKLVFSSLFSQHSVPRAHSLDLFSFYTLSLVISSSLMPLNTIYIFVSFILPVDQTENQSWTPTSDQSINPVGFTFNIYPISVPFSPSPQGSLWSHSCTWSTTVASYWSPCFCPCSFQSVLTWSTKWLS